VRAAHADRAAEPSGGMPLLAVVGVTLLVQLVLQAYFFPLSALWDAARLVHIDAPFHQYQMEVARQLCAEQRLTGYDIFFAAGHLGGVSFNASAKLPALLACLDTASANIPVIYKQFSFWSGVLAPAMLVATCVLLRLPVSVAAVVALFSVLLWWTGAIRWYHAAGLVSYVIVAFASVPFAVAALRVCRRPTLWRLALLTVVAAIGLLVHPLFVVAAALIGLPLLVDELRAGLRIANVVAVVAVLLAGMLLLNGIWLWPSLTTPSFATIVHPYQRAVDPTLVLQELLGLAPTAAGGSRLYNVLWIGALLCIGCWRGSARRALLALIAAAVLLMIWASFGAVIPALASLQPNRFSALAWLCLVVPAAAGVVAAAQQIPAAHGFGRWLRGAALLIVAGFLAFFVREAEREILAPAETGRYAVAAPEVKGEGGLSRPLLDFLGTQTDASARVFFELSLARVHDGGHMAGLYALASNREFIGGPYPFTDFASAWDDFAFGKPYAEHSPEQLNAFLDAYNIRWMLCHSTACRAAMAALPGVDKLADLGPVTAFVRAASPGFVVHGSARVVERCINRVTLADAAGSPLILRYHWVPGLVSVPPARIEAVDIVPGARPFIAIHDPPPDLTLRVGDGPGQACDARARPSP
jgi:hypothetical protein